ncbi:MAG: hypothetical protein PHY73_04550 [Candidatus Omnitrophica bacterium]|nr:hypothetical protein [Candidatus Omnitrophota bacterium]
MLKTLQTKKAYSLVEIIATVILFSVGILGILAAFSFASKDTRISNKKLMAANKGRALLEDMRARVDTRTPNAWNLTCNGAAHSWPNGESFDGKPIVYSCSDHTSGARQVTLTVEWDD